MHMPVVWSLHLELFSLDVTRPNFCFASGYFIIFIIIIIIIIIILLVFLKFQHNGLR